MFREQYNQLNEQIHADENLLINTIRKAAKTENKPHKKCYSILRPAIALLSVCLVLSLSMSALAAASEPVYEIMYMVSPAIAQFFMPVHKSDEDNGIKMEVVSAYIHENVAEIYITMQDLTKDRIDETTDLFDSYAINRPFSSSARCERVGFDDITRTATFLITIEEWGNRDITGDKITFTVREFLSNKQIYDDIEIPLSLSSADLAKDIHHPSTVTGWSGSDYQQFDKENPVALVPSAPMDAFPVEGIDLTGIGYIDGKLHIQTAVTDNSENDNHGYFYLQDCDGNRIDSSYSFTFINKNNPPGRINYCNYVFDVPQNHISGYTLHGYFVTSSLITKGNWNVTFPLEYRRE